MDRTCGTERWTNTQIRISILELGGRSSKEIKGMEMEEMEGGRELRKADCVGEEKLEKVRNVAEKP